MKNLVLFVFKFVGTAIILMFVLDTSCVVFDAISTNNQIKSVANLMQMEVAENNCILSAGSNNDVFQKSLDDISKSSRISKEILYNSTDSVISGSKGLDSDNVGQYGDIKELVITNHISFTLIDLSVHTDEVKRSGWGSDFVVTYNYKVPCLRYLK